MKILVTGGRGFVGKHLVTAFELKGHEVFVTSSTKCLNTSGNSIYWNLDDFELSIPELPEVDCVVHLAANVHKGTTLSSVMSVNALGTAKVFEAAKFLGAKKFFLLSSISVYGLINGGKNVEINASYNPRTPYAVSKVLGECLLGDAYCTKDISKYIFRCPVVYGHGDRGNFSRLLKVVQRFGMMIDFNLDNARSVLHVKNLADAFCYAVEADISPGIYFIEDEQRFSAKTFVKELSTASTRDYKSIYLPKTLFAFFKTILGGIADKVWGELTLSRSGGIPGFKPKYTMYNYFEDLQRKDK